MGIPSEKERATKSEENRRLLFDFQRERARGRRQPPTTDLFAYRSFPRTLAVAFKASRWTRKKISLIVYSKHP